MPIETICDVLQVPGSDRTMLMEWNKQTLSSTSLDDTLLDALNARNEIILYFIDLVEERRAAPGDDPISALAHGRVQGEQLSTEDVALNCYSLILGERCTATLTSGGR
jgi:cytochrome P450